MSKPFHLVDLFSQEAAVQQVLLGLSIEEKLAWLAAHGRVTERPQSLPSTQRIYEFVSGTGRPCIFLVDGNDLVVLGY